jgi:hypothetical protein
VPPPVAPDVPVNAVVAQSIPLSFDHVAIKKVKHVITVFEVGSSTDTPAFEWTKDARRKSGNKWSDGDNGNFLNFCKTYIYIHNNIDSLAPEQKIEPTKFRNGIEKNPNPNISYHDIAVTKFLEKKLSTITNDDGSFIYV